LGNPQDAALAQRFFKTGPGEYGEGDRFLGVRVPVLRQLAKEYRDVSLEQTTILLQSPFHEIRMLALLIWILQVKRGGGLESIYRAYIDHLPHINNWDLVDCSAEHLVGAYYANRCRAPLMEMAQSRNLWERRIAIIATFYFIRRNQFDDTLRLADQLKHDPEDLMHKAVGWMLREVGKRNMEIEESFLLQHYKILPRTLLRYAIERFPEPVRLAYLHGSR